jgi:hypothetical protein
MNEISKKLKDKNKKGNCRKLFLFIARSCEHFLSFGVHKNMNVKNVIENL